ncbi:hypothetical protein ACIF8W_28370 [Streptomyces sp. NPDC085639]|uniref:hypothetical protein n=1 Tax=Streptomyces sp. NPDC085639 TaxID=3365734 RepID=UPI0037D77597
MAQQQAQTVRPAVTYTKGGIVLFRGSNGSGSVCPATRSSAGWSASGGTSTPARSSTT